MANPILVTGAAGRVGAGQGPLSYSHIDTATLRGAIDKMPDLTTSSE